MSLWGFRCSRRDAEPREHRDWSFIGIGRFSTFCGSANESLWFPTESGEKKWQLLISSTGSFCVHVSPAFVSLFGGSVFSPLFFSHHGHSRNPFFLRPLCYTCLLFASKCVHLNSNSLLFILVWGVDLIPFPLPPLRVSADWLIGPAASFDGLQATVFWCLGVSVFCELWPSFNSSFFLRQIETGRREQGVGEGSDDRRRENTTKGGGKQNL